MPASSAPPPAPDDVFDVRPIPCRVKHAQIFQRWIDLPVGGAFVLLNDHDPVPLHDQFDAQFPGACGWEYLAAGPDEFRVRITKRRALPGTAAATAAATPPCGTAATDVDARALEALQPGRT